MSKEEGGATNGPDQGAMDQLSAHIDRGWDLIDRGDFPGAQASAEHCIALDAESPEAYNLLGYARAAQGDPDAALEHYRYAIALDDTFVEAMLNAADVLIHPVHDFEGAIEMIDEALDFAEGDDEIAEVLLVKFEAFLHQGDREGAARVLQDLPEGPFETPRAEFLMGRAFHEIGDAEKALVMLERATARDPHHAEAFHVLGSVLDALERRADATLAFLRSRELDTHGARPPWSMTTEDFERIVRRVVEGLALPLREALEGTLVVIADLPGPEVVVDGVDPRAGILLDATSERAKPPRVGRLFVYQRNVERGCEGPDTLSEELAHLITTELAATFPELREAAGFERDVDASEH